MAGFEIEYTIRMALFQVVYGRMCGDKIRCVIMGSVKAGCTDHP
jgi:hypothetical protein